MKKGKMDYGAFEIKPAVGQIADNLRAAIVKGIWENYLPTERSLCNFIDTSRPTLRKALHQLQSEGVIKINPGKPTRISASHLKQKKRSANKRAVLLFGDALYASGNWSVMLVEKIREELFRRGYQSEVVVDFRLKRKNPAAVLEGLATRHAADYWVLSSLPFSVQQWFQERGVPAVVNGVTFPEITLPSADCNHFAMARHATGVFLGMGHRRIVRFMRGLGTAGEVAMEEGFAEAFRGHDDSAPRVIRHTGEVKSIRACLKALLAEKEKCTAILVSHPIDMLVIMTSLLEWKVRIPHEISLISHHPESFFDSLTPVIARYEIDPVKLARAISRLIENPALGGGCIRLIPGLFRGGSLAPPPALAPKN